MGDLTVGSIRTLTDTVVPVGPRVVDKTLVSTIDFMNPLPQHMTTDQKTVILLERSAAVLVEIRDILLAGLDADGLRALKAKGTQQKPKQGRR